MQCTSIQATLPVSRPLPESRSQSRRTMFAGFAARGRSSLNCRELHWTAPGKLAAVQPSPWLYSGSYRPTQKKETGRKTKNSTTKGEKDVPRKGGKAWDSATKEIKQIQRARTRNDRGQQSVRNILNLSKRTMGRQSNHHTDTKPTKPRKETEQPTKQRHRKTAGAGRTHKHRKTTKPRKEEREAGRQHKTGGERAHKNQRGCSSALADARWGSWIITDEYLSEEAQSTPTTHTQWCRGYTTPHRATAFDATGCTKSRNKALQHAKQNARQPSRTQGNDTWREAPVSTWTRQPRGVVRMGGGGNNTHQHQKANKQPRQDKKHNGSVSAKGVRS